MRPNSLNSNDLPRGNAAAASDSGEPAALRAWYFGARPIELRAFLRRPLSWPQPESQIGGSNAAFALLAMTARKPTKALNCLQQETPDSREEACEGRCAGQEGRACAREGVGQTRCRRGSQEARSGRACGCPERGPSRAKHAERTHAGRREASAEREATAAARAHAAAQAVCPGAAKGARRADKKAIAAVRSPARACRKTGSRSSSC